MQTYSQGSTMPASFIHVVSKVSAMLSFFRPPQYTRDILLISGVKPTYTLTSRRLQGCEREYFPNVMDSAWTRMSQDYTITILNGKRSLTQD